jgi:predicted nucleic acid-binding protein
MWEYEGATPWAIPWPCLGEFFSVVTHPRIYDPPSTTDQAIHQIDAWLAASSVVPIGESLVGYWAELKAVLTGGKVTGALVRDARIAGLCAANGVRELWTMDRDFSRFPALKTRNPL